MCIGIELSIIFKSYGDNINFKTAQHFNIIHHLRYFPVELMLIEQLTINIS
jgi:hypothetical protein